MMIANKEPWVAKAACAVFEVDPEMFFPDAGGPQTSALQICQACPVRLKCLGYALERRERHGIWGGMGEKQRDRLLRRKLKQAT